jgi:hypothetical protein
VEDKEKRGYVEVLANKLGYSFSWVQERLDRGADLDLVIDTLRRTQRMKNTKRNQAIHDAIKLVADRMGRYHLSERPFAGSATDKQSRIILYLRSQVEK